MLIKLMLWKRIDLDLQEGEYTLAVALLRTANVLTLIK